MLQFIIWALCVVILALGYIAKLVFVLTLPAEKRTKNSGTGIFAIFLLLAGAIFVMSIMQGQEIQNILGR
jgi:vacuolar-type H+-ATPase subunit I/STV1